MGLPVAKIAVLPAVFCATRFTSAIVAIGVGAIVVRSLLPAIVASEGVVELSPKQRCLAITQLLALWVFTARL